MIGFRSRSTSSEKFHNELERLWGGSNLVNADDDDDDGLKLMRNVVDKEGESMFA
jgi:hypothetical protein